METLNLYQNNVAYDFEMFAPKPKPEREAPVINYPTKKAKDKLNSERKARRKTSALGTGVIIAVMLVVLFANVFTRAKISQVDMQINKQQKEILKLDSEITRLQCEVQSKMTYEFIEAKAIELGMQKMERSQIKYVNVNGEITLETEMCAYEE